MLPAQNVEARSQFNPNEGNLRRSQSELTVQRTIIGKTAHCIDPSCKGWLVDSVLGERYWIQCIDEKHAVNRDENRKAGSFGGEARESAGRPETTSKEVILQ